MFILDLEAPVITAYYLPQDGPSWLMVANARGEVQQAVQAQAGAPWRKITAQVDARLVAELQDAFVSTSLVSATSVADDDSADIFMLKAFAEGTSHQLQGGTHGGVRPCAQVHELAVYWLRLSELLPERVPIPSAFTCTRRS